MKLNQNTIEKECTHQNKSKQNEFCNNCGAIIIDNVNIIIKSNFYIQNITSKHYKYNYKPELSPKELFKKMVLSNKEPLELKQELNIKKENTFYTSIRKDITTLLKKINSSFENSSSTYYLSIYYLDKIFNLPNINEYLNKYEYIAKNMKNIFIKKNTRNYKVQKKKK